MNTVYEHPLEIMLSVLLGINPDVELLDHVVIVFLICFRSQQTVFHSNCTTLPSHRQRASLPTFPRPHQVSLFSTFVNFFCSSRTNG